MLRLFLSWVGEWRFAENFRPDLTGIYDSQSNPLQCDQTSSGHYNQSPQHGCIVFFMSAKKPYIMTLQTPLHPPNNKVVTVYSDYSGNSGPKGPHLKDLNIHRFPQPATLILPAKAEETPAATCSFRYLLVLSTSLDFSATSHPIVFIKSFDLKSTLSFPLDFFPI